MYKTYVMESRSWQIWLFAPLAAEPAKHASRETEDK